MANYLGIDVGTSGSKALLMNAAGKVLGTATATHGIYSPRPGWSEQNPEEWWTSAVRATRAAVKKAGVNGRTITAVGLSGQMQKLACPVRSWGLTLSRDCRTHCGNGDTNGRFNPT